MNDPDIPQGATWVCFPKFIGDSVWHFPILRLLRLMGLGPIVVYGPQTIVGLLRDNELSDCVVAIDKRPNIFRLIQMLRHHRPKRWISFLKSHRLLVAAWLAGVPERIGRCDDGMRILNTHHASLSGTGHIVLRYWAALAKRWPDIPAMPFADYRPTAQVERPKGDYICLMPNSVWPPKDWPADYFRKLAAIARESGLDIV
ncbi:MAG: glycosyltransferase family 9 protein, partial [Holophagales bacterium]|nr:glycosyltransferase family 9 protein [Holophagales bacterium]